jgi:hypothetical protein
MSTGEVNEWTPEELEQLAADVNMATWSYSQQLADALRGQLPQGPFIPSPDTFRQFAEAMKKLWIAALREAADLLEGKPLPQPPQQPPAQNPPPAVNQADATEYQEP